MNCNCLSEKNKKLNNKTHQANHINRAGNTLFTIGTDSHKIIYSVWDREDKTIPCPGAHPRLGHVSINKALIFKTV